MNIIIKGANGIYCRPDTSWERENRDFYLPEEINACSWAPVIFARVSKAGKYIGEKFVGRYYDAVNFGAMLYVEDLLDGGPCSIAGASCADKTSVLPFPLYNPITLEGENEVEMYLGDNMIYSAATSEREFKALIEEALVEVSRRVSLRIGDIVAVELREISHLLSREDGSVNFRASYCGNEIFNYNIL